MDPHSEEDRYREDDSRQKSEDDKIKWLKATVSTLAFTNEICGLVSHALPHHFYEGPTKHIIDTIAIAAAHIIHGSTVTYK